LSHWYKRILGFFIFLDWTESHCQLPPQSKAMACYLQVERHLDPDAQKRVLSFAPGSDIFNRQGRLFVHIVLNLILPNPPFLSSRKIWIQIICDWKIIHPLSLKELRLLGGLVFIFSEKIRRYLPPWLKAII